jgi:hypothetical protein
VISALLRRSRGGSELPARSSWARSLLILRRPSIFRRASASQHFTGTSSTGGHISTDPVLGQIRADTVELNVGKPIQPWHFRLEAQEEGDAAIRCQGHVCGLCRFLIFCVEALSVCGIESDRTRVPQRRFLAERRSGARTRELGQANAKLVSCRKDR